MDQRTTYSFLAAFFFATAFFGAAFATSCPFGLTDLVDFEEFAVFEDAADFDVFEVRDCVALGMNLRLCRQSAHSKRSRLSYGFVRGEREPFDLAQDRLASSRTMNDKRKKVASVFQAFAGAL
ncbi:MAG TPA: hypothetical protein VIQ01_10590 [Burkholderiales bacterium]